MTDLKRSRAFTILRYRRGLITAAVLALLIYILLPQADALWRSLDIVRDASLPLVLVALLMTALTYALAAEIYYLLLKHPVPLREVALVQAATALTSRIAPIGVGTMGLNAIFLRRRKHRLSEALAVVTVNNSLGVIGHCILIGIVALSASLPADMDITPGWHVLYWGMILFSAGLITVTVSDKLRRNLFRAVGSLGRAIAGYRRKPGRLVQALIVSMALSLVYVFALAATGQALGLHLPFSQYFLVYTFSLLTGVATPTPGGLVGVEAGLVAGFVAYDIGVDTALAVALLYRLLTYWLPLVPGYLAFRTVQRRYL